jgi:ribosome-interacting GTPase 1
VPMLVVLNKIDLADEEYLEKTRLEMPEAIFIAADKGINTEELKDEIFDRLELIRLYLKPQGKKADLEEPMIIRKGSTVGEVAARLHRDFIRNFRHAKVWGTSVKFPGQKVGLDHVLNDKDVLRLIIKK